MTRAAAPPRNGAAAGLRLPLPLWISAYHGALAGVLVLAAALDLVALDREGYANSYYAAAVLSMLKSWHNFFFVAFDPGGFLAVDKPPLGLWIQAASAKLLGFSGVSLLLPQALAGVASVAVLTHLVSGSGAGFRGASADVNADLTRWITTSCRLVPASAYGSAAGTGGFGGPGQLYDCR